MKSKPLDRVYFGQYQASSTALGVREVGTQLFYAQNTVRVAGFVYTVSGLSSKIGSLYHLVQERIKTGD